MSRPAVAIVDGDADTAQIAAFEHDRRALLRRGLGLGLSGAVAASTIPLLLGVRYAFAVSDGDGGILENAITLERVAVIAYDAALGGGLLTAGVERLMRDLRAHEQAHAQALQTALKDLGGTPPPPPSGASAIDRVAGGLPDARTQADVLRFAIELETAAVAAYFDAHRKLNEARLLQTGASIMASEGQHLVLLRQALGRDPVPDAFESGAR